VPRHVEDGSRQATGRLRDARQTRHRRFDYNVPSWKPQVEFNAGTLRISQQESHRANFGDTKYEWNLRVNRDVPLELTINLNGTPAANTRSPK
jgi:hypothetical protein